MTTSHGEQCKELNARIGRMETEKANWEKEKERLLNRMERAQKEVDALKVDMEEKEAMQRQEVKEKNVEIEEAEKERIKLLHSICAEMDRMRGHIQTLNHNTG